ncbi:MAG: M48 family metalloprotease [Terracidiphilus sp.]
MKRLLATPLCALLLCAMLPGQSTSSSGVSQIGNIGNALTGKKKNAQQDPNAVIDLSNVDKDKIARIEAMPEVADAIQQEWDELRKNDMQLAYGINLTENWGMAQDTIAGDSFDRQRLYVNPVIQSYVNHVGQRLVPRNSGNVYTFRVLYDPIPKALTLSTGTIYISTGLLSMLDTEGELSYVLAHEIAHLELRQAYLRIRDKHVMMELAKEKAEKEKIVTDVGSMVMGAGLGGALIPFRLGGSLLGGSAGLATGMEVGHYFIHPQIEPVIWEGREEDDADDMAMHLMLEQGYDPRQIEHLFTTLNQVVTADSRMGLGFMGSAPRVKGREAHLNALLNGQLKAEVELRAKGKGFNPDDPDFTPMVASVRRDNGILAMDYDLFAVAKRNLESAVSQRPDDASAHFYLAKLERLTARTPGERQDAISHLTMALKLDSDRGAIPAAHMEYAVALIEEGDPANKDQITGELKAYVALSERDHAGLPANMQLIYDYMSAAGDSRWFLPPQWYGAQLTNNPGFTTTAPEAVIRKASMLEGPTQSAPAPATTPAPAAHGKGKPAKPATAQVKPPSAKANTPAAN